MPLIRSGKIEAAVEKALDWAYDRSLKSDIPIVDSAFELAAKYRKGEGGVAQQADRMIRREILNSAAGGMISGVGGAFALPASVPLQFGLLLFYRIRMATAVAILAGFDPTDPKIKALVFSCLIGGSESEDAQSWLRDFARGSTAGSAAGAAYGINKIVIKQLTTRYGGKWLLRLDRAIPVIGGAVSSAAEVTAARAVGRAAKEIFIFGDL